MSAEDFLYPALEPYAADRLPAGGRHTIYFEQCGNPSGFPVFFLHGGPGSNVRPQHRRFFDPRFYRVVLADQRGCGRSAPLGCTDENTTGDLVADIEALRRHLGLERVLLFGGSWGRTLALAYAGAHPDRVAGMVLRGVFLASCVELDWYLDGLRSFVPEAWQALSGGESGHLIARYHALVNQTDERQTLAAAQRWLGYEEAVMRLGATDSVATTAPDSAAALARARVQLHYLAHDCFLQPGELSSHMRKLGDVPVTIVQGRLDMVCPPRAAFELAAESPRLQLHIVERGGHSASEPLMAAALCRATDDMQRHLDR
jgi:proline iminopeptidase